ncbi:MAG: hydroxymethylglutaryl-CoA lyase [Ilumatobacter sp.]|uniref:hydroxymethylglutaryl-CoA lyase n=1 Tax=Ilumatobacter sp. TaxID=1967498 RepID=UPI00260BD586|nr:hydroxymethylglutaryl-CoA lyase [Ilumatobacter sp.]MDJ0767781.1 hydroxymethylglutaryl-CoA lyase [Ilumatobacter sp.]
MVMIAIRDVCPRDGLQSEAPVDPARRARLALALAHAGVREVEAASFVSPRAVPSMAGGGGVFEALPRDGDVDWWALVPNARGAELAIEAGVTHVTVTISASEGYSRKNVGRTTTEAIASLAEIADAVGDDAHLDVVVSCAFGSPFGDVADPSATCLIAERTCDVMPTARLTLADTTGTATPRRIAEVIAAVPEVSTDDLGLHLHDTRGTALANALAAIELGVRRFDTAAGGLGGSPFAPGAGGNLATEDLVMTLHDLGHETGVDLDAVLTVSRGLPDLVGHDVPSRVHAAGGLPPFGAGA